MGPNGYLVAAAFAATSLLTWAGGRFGFITKDRWKDLSTFSVLLGVVGLLGIFSDSSRRFADLELTYERESYGSKGEVVVEATTSKRDYFCQTKFVKSESSPEDFDALGRDQEVLCQWFRDVYDIVIKHEYAKYIPVTPAIPDRPVLETEGWSQMVAEFDQSVAMQDEITLQLRRLSDNSRVGGAELLYFLFAPFAVAVALGIQLSKSRFS